jgi:predicted DNA-binding ribbon-helix-helix protein
MKRSLSIRGHRTSISVEDEFWAAFQAIARERRESVAGLVARIDAERGATVNLSSAIRVFVLADLQERLQAEDGRRRLSSEPLRPPAL